MMRTSSVKNRRSKRSRRLVDVSVTRHALATETQNAKIASSIDFSQFYDREPDLIVGENGVVLNYDSNNPLHRKWIED